MNQKLLEKLLSSSSLPTLPKVAIDLLDLIEQTDVNIDAIALTISNDPALTSKILKTANSSFYGQRKQVSTLSKAVLVLGLNSTKLLALGFMLVGKFAKSTNQDFNGFAFWKRCLCAAVAARSFAEHKKIPHQEEIFLGGLLQDIGVLAMVQVIGDEYLDLVFRAGDDHAELFKLEQEKFDLDHAQVGAALAEHWGLPQILIEPIHFHVKYEECSEKYKPLIHCIVLGNAMADLLLRPPSQHSRQCMYENAEQWLGIPQSQTEIMLPKIHAESLQFAKLFELPVGGLNNPEDILARANENMLEISLEQQRRAQQLQKSNQDLTAQLVVDPLTGVANRRGLDEYVKKHFAAASTQGGALSMLFLDLDRFKSMNDNHSHQLGDKVLKSVARILNTIGGEDFLAARFGGDEFAVVLPGFDKFSAMRLAENLQKQIMASKVDIDGQESVSVTASIGVATYEEGCFSVEKQLFQAADHATYIAKAAGGNCVRVFSTPQSTSQVEKER